MMHLTCLDPGAHKLTPAHKQFVLRALHYPCQGNSTGLRHIQLCHLYLTELYRSEYIVVTRSNST